jgi:hypothetical protein
VPLVRDLATGAERRIIDEFTDPGSTPVTRVYDAIDKAWTMGDRAIEGEEIKRPLKQTADIAALLLGQPLSQPGTTAQFAWEVRQGEVEPDSVSDWYFGLTRGKVPEEEEER